MAFGNRLQDHLGQFVYGGIDGSVTTFAVVAGAVGAGFDTGVILVLGIANLIADGFSMGASAYLSAKSERDMAAARNSSVQRLAGSPRVAGVATFVSFVVVGALPLVVYIVQFITGAAWSGAFVAASLLTAAAFAGIGWLKGVLTRTNRLRAALETLALGTIAAMIAYVLGSLLERVIA